MKKILNYITAISIALAAGGCTDDFDPKGTLQPSLTAHYLGVTETVFGQMAAGGASRSFAVNSYETPWAFSETPSWVRLTPGSGSDSQQVTLRVDANDNADAARTAVFFLSSTDPEWEFNQALSVSQTAAEATLTVNKQELTFGGAGGSQTVKVTSNYEWPVTVPHTWLSATSDHQTGELVLTASPNPQNTYRMSTIWVGSMKYGQKRIDITQAPSEITASDLSLQCENMAGKYDVQLTAEADWNAVASESWISISPDNGPAGVSTISIEVSPNASVDQRTGYVTIYADVFAKLQIEIRQLGLYIEAEDDDRVFLRSCNSNATFGLRSNTMWQVTSKPNWLAVDPEYGIGDASLTIYSEANTNNTPRTGEIRIGQPGLAMECVIHVTQAGISLEPDKTYLEFSDKGGTLDFKLLTDSFWTSTLSDSWFTATPADGKGEAVISVTAEENPGDERAGTITYNWGWLPVSVYLTQLGKYLYVDNPAFEFGSKGGSHEIELSTNNDWTATVDNGASWLHLSRTSGSGNEVITLTADDNASVNVRSTTVSINSANSQGVRILVSQQPRHLALSASSVLFFANGGTAEPITVDTDGTFSITQEGSWFTVDRSDNWFTVSTTKNEDYSPRTGSITVALTDLKEGSLALTLSVVQGGEGGSFIVSGYAEDKDWGKTGDNELNLSVTGFTTDVDWDSVVTNAVTVSVAGYSSDNDWNKGMSSNCNVTLHPYGTDIDWNSAGMSLGTFTFSHYGSDKSWNKNTDSNGNIKTDGYGSEKDWNTNNGSNGNIKTDDYGSDKDWNTNNDSNGNIKTDGYGSDKNWNTTNGSNGNIEVKGYGADVNWNDK